jgi:HAMP domain-containing protein
MNSIRLVFPVIFALEIVLAVSLTVAIGYTSQMKEARETAAQFLVLIAGMIEDQLDRHLSVPASLVRNYAKEARRQPATRFDDLLKPALVGSMIDSFQTQAHAAHGMNLNFANPAGQNLMLDRRGYSKPVVKLSDFGKGGAVSWYPFDAFARGGEPQEVLRVGYDPRKQPYYIAAVSERQAVVSSVYSSPLVKGGAVVTVAEPVYDGRGRLRAVVSSDIDLRVISMYLQGLRLPDAAVVFMFDADGYFIASSRRQPVAPSGEGAGGGLPSILDNRDPAIRAMAESMQKQSGSFFIPAPAQFQFVTGEGRQYAYATPLAGKFGLNWKLAVVIPETGLIDNLLQGIYSTAWVSLALLLVAIAVGSLTAAWMINPILTMGAVAQAVEKNELTEPPLPARQLQKDTRRRNEFGALAQVFLRMIGEIKARQTLMEAQLEQLRVDVDHEDTQAQVRQIASGEFFRNLQSQARRLREARKPAPESAVRVSSDADE